MLLHPLGYQLIVRACLTLKAIDFFPDVTLNDVATIINSLSTMAHSPNLEGTPLQQCPLRDI